MALNSSGSFKSHSLFLLPSGLIVVCLSLLVYLLILKSVYGRFTVSQIAPDVSSFENLLKGYSPQTAILSSGYTQNMLPDESRWQNENLHSWEKFFNNISIKYDLLTDQQIEAGEHFKYKLLVLPGSKSLSDDEIVNIKKYLTEGGSVFATGGTASYSSDGKWRGWQFLSDVFGIRHKKEIGYEDRTKVHTLRGGLPVTANIPPGFTLNVASWDRPIAAEVLDPRTTQVSFWYNHKVEAGLVRDEIKQTAGIVYGNYGKGRFIWMGFEINSILGLQQDYVIFERLFNNCMSWLSYNPIAFLREWPNGFKSAAALAAIISADDANLQNLVNYLKEKEIKSTFFLESSLTEQETATLRQLSNLVEICPVVHLNYISYTDKQEINFFNYENQLKNLNNSKTFLESLLDKPIKGMYPFSGFHNENTVKALINSGYSYLITDSSTDRSVPQNLIRGENRAVLIPRNVKDDLEVIRDLHLNKKEFQFYTYQEDIDRIAFEGGLYLLKIHPEYQCVNENVEVLGDVLTELKSKNFWIATLSEIQEWYDKKDYVEIRAQRRGNSRIVITITNFGIKNINNLVLDVDLNEKAEKIFIDAEIIGTKIPDFSHTDGSQFISLYIDELEKNGSRTYYIDYDKTEL